MANKERWRIEDYLFFFVLLLEDAGMFNILPIGIAQILILILGTVIIVKRKGVIKINYKIVIIMLYISGITLFNRFDYASIKGMILFFVELIVLYCYLCTFNSYEKLFSLIYKAAFVLAVIGIIQEIGYVAGINALCDMTIYGFPRENVYETGFIFARVSSLYSEPASMSAILSAAFFVGLLGSKEIGVSRINFSIICIFILFSQSTVTYVSCVIVLVLYTLFSNIGHKRKIVIVVAAVILISILLVVRSGIVIGILSKLSTLKTASSENSTDLSAFALISNIRIAVAKNLDGYVLGTGFNSHRLYYEDYIYRFYSNIYMKLNYNDAGSLYTRVLSEFGIMGFLVFLFQLMKNLGYAIRKKSNYLLVCSIVPMISFIRNGNYNNTLCITLLIVVFFFRNNVDSKMNLLSKGELTE